MKRIKTTCYCGCPIGTEDYPDGKEEFTFVEVNAECPLCAVTGEYSKSPYYTDPLKEALAYAKAHPQPLAQPTDIIPLKGKRVVPAPKNR